MEMQERIDVVNTDIMSMDADTMANKYLTFSMDEDVYAIRITYVREIIGYQMITPVPNQVNYIKGVINLRGKIIPTMDIRMRFNKEARAYDDRTCIVVVNVDELAVGIVVDRVDEVMNLLPDQISKTPSFTSDIHEKYIEGIVKKDNHPIVLLDCKKIISSTDYDPFSGFREE